MEISYGTDESSSFCKLARINGETVTCFNRAKLFLSYATYRWSWMTSSESSPRLDD